jgi:hypothetical protein
MDRKSAGFNPVGIAVDAPNVDTQPKSRKWPLRHRILAAHARRKPARVSAQPTNLNFFAAIVRAVKSTSHGPDATLGRSIAADPAVRLCIGCSSENGCGESERSSRDDDREQVRAAGPEFVGGYVPRPDHALRFLRPQKEEGAGRFRDLSGPPAPFLRSSQRETGR